MTSSVAPKKQRREHVKSRDKRMARTTITPPPCYEPDPYQLTFYVSDLPKTPNSLLGANWVVRAGHAKKWDRLVWKAVWPFRPSQPLAKAKLTLLRSSSKALDYEGLVGSFKAPIDALVKNGILLDDSMVVIGQPTYLHEMGKRGGGFVMMKVEAV